MDNRTFKVAGVSTDPKGSTKIRFANDYVARIKILNMRRHTDINLIELEKPRSPAGRRMRRYGRFSFSSTVSA